MQGQSLLDLAIAYFNLSHPTFCGDVPFGCRANTLENPKPFNPTPEKLYGAQNPEAGTGARGLIVTGFPRGPSDIQDLTEPQWHWGHFGRSLGLKPTTSSLQS